MGAIVRVLRLSIVFVVLVLAPLAICVATSRLPEDVGTSRFGVLQRDMQFEFAGAWIRPHPGPFIWGWVERTPGRYDWRETDSTVSKLQSLRLAILATIWPFAEWDQSSCYATHPQAQGAFGEFGNLLYAPCDAEAYAAWVTALVERYDGDGVDDMPGLQYPIQHWEVLNEPEMQGPELCFFQEPPQSYVELLAISYAAIKSADSTAVVLLAGQAGMHMEATDYWSEVLANPRTTYDIANIHSINCSDIQQDAAFWAPEYIFFLAALGHGGSPYWITESATGSMDPKHKLDDDAATEDRNARHRFIGTVVAFAEGAERIFHCVAFDPRGKKLQVEVGVFNLLGTAIGEFETATRTSPSSVCFTMPDGRQIYALWDGARLPSEEMGSFVVTSYLGDVSNQEASTIVADVPLLAHRLP